MVSIKIKSLKLQLTLSAAYRRPNTPVKHKFIYNNHNNVIIFKIFKNITFALMPSCPFDISNSSKSCCGKRRA